MKKVSKIKFKRWFIIIVIVVCLGFSESIGVIPYVVARITSSIYVTINYSSKGLKFESAEYAYGFGDYFVRYKDKEGKSAGFMLFPKEFPILIRSDSIKGEN